MKKLFFLGLLVLLCTSPAQAKTGDMAGTYYATDIVTSLNGFPIEAINIGGKTLIDAEAMEYYGFSVLWISETRCLDITSTRDFHGMRPAVEGDARPAGTPLGNYYETDIVTYLDGDPITAYNIGGRTFLYAEEMAKLGYIVKWNAAERTLDVTSPLQAGYVYSIDLTKGEAVTEEGCGSFSIFYTPDGVTTAGDANYFHSDLSFDGKTWSLRMAFYQYEGLFRAGALIQKLDAMKSFDVTGYECDPAEKYALTDESLLLTINGERAKNICISRSQGNGHVDFTLTFDLPERYTKQELRAVRFSLDDPGNQTGDNAPFLSRHDEAMDGIWTYPDDFMVKCISTGDHYLIQMRECPAPGTVTDRLYLVNQQTGACSTDLLDQVRAIEGFDSGRMTLSFEPEGGDSLLTCSVPEGISGQFRLDALTGLLHRLG